MSRKQCVVALKSLGVDGSFDEILCSISYNLDFIHQDYVHRDFHSGNILMISTRSVKTIPYPIDGCASGSEINEVLHVSKTMRSDENVSNKIYGVVPYVAAEVLQGGKFTKAADIYGFGVI
ncbi:12918_t:CDS:2, partial [Racocetra fulgida]